MGFFPRRELRAGLRESQFIKKVKAGFNLRRGSDQSGLGGLFCSLGMMPRRDRSPGSQLTRQDIEADLHSISYLYCSARNFHGRDAVVGLEQRDFPLRAQPLTFLAQTQRETHSLFDP